MIVRLRLGPFDQRRGRIPLTQSAVVAGHYFDFECEVVKPPSSEGRTVRVFLDDDDVVWLLHELRAFAAEVRSTPMTDGER